MKYLLALMLLGILLGCDGEVTCEPGQACNSTDPVGPTCEWQCQGKACGPNGCGGVCGTCPTGQTCTPDGQCGVPPVPTDGDLIGTIRLLHQVAPREVGSLLGELGKAEASFWDFEPLPNDDRTTYITVEGEPCTLETGSEYPFYFDGATWPSGPGRTAGDLTFAVAGAPGPIVLEAMDADEGGPEVYGWAYIHDSVPPPLEDDTTVLPDFFDIAYVPPGALFSVSAGGGGAHRRPILGRRQNAR
ncbi:hypothetical protein ACFL6C_09430 [Myxococcota bacterium]